MNARPNLARIDEQGQRLADQAFRTLISLCPEIRSASPARQEAVCAAMRAKVAPTITLDDPELEADVASAEASWQQPAKDKPVRTRADSKQALVIGLLQRPEGATIAQIMEATGWQQHTCRGTLAGTLKKRLGLTITSAKEAGGQRVYRIESASAGTATAINSEAA